MRFPRPAIRLASIVVAALPTAAGDRARFIRARSALDAGIRPPRLEALASRLLERADGAHAEGDGASAVEWADKALQLLFHSTVHYGTAPAPMGDRDLGLLRPLRESEVGRLLTVTPDPPRPERPGGEKVLVLAASSWTFIDRVTRELEDRSEFTFRRRDLSGLPAGERPSRRGVLEARYAWSAHGERSDVPTQLREDIEWADVIWMEWASYPAAWLTLLAGVDKRIVVRLHRYEAYTQFPQLIDMDQVDHLVFIAGHVRDLVEASAPRAARAHGVSVVPNINDLEAYGLQKSEESARTVLQVGWANPVKDVDFALDLLELLRAHDPSWRLLLAGHGLEGDDDRTVRLRARIDAQGSGIEELGYRTDMPQVMQRAGFILSASLSEGSHEAVTEGAAAGCVPVVRDWPDVRAWGGPATVFPREWIVADPVEAARRMIATAEGEYESSRAAARHWASTERDIARIAESYSPILRGSETPRG